MKKIQEEEEKEGEEIYIHEFKHTFVKEQLEKEKELFEDFIVRNGFFFFRFVFFTEQHEKSENEERRKGIV